MSELHPHHEDHPDVISHNARMGLGLFVLYFVLYIGFLLLNVFLPGTMALTAIPVSATNEISLGGPNLAVVTGIALIFAAFILALVYMRLTKGTRSGDSGGTSSGPGNS